MFNRVFIVRCFKQTVLKYVDVLLSCVFDFHIVVSSGVTVPLLSVIFRNSDSAPVLHWLSNENLKTHYVCSCCQVMACRQVRMKRGRRTSINRRSSYNGLQFVGQIIKVLLRGMEGVLFSLNNNSYCYYN